MLRNAMAFALLFTGAAAIAVPRVAPVAGPGPATPLPTRVEGRAVALPGGAGWLRQWPGTAFETGVRGDAVAFRLGAGDVRLHLLADGRPVATLVKPAPGTYRIDGLGAGRHIVRVEVASESQAGATGFGGFFAPPGTRAAALAPRAHRIEFIGDSHTVGYGNTRARQDCTPDEVWASTDTSRAYGPILAHALDAEVLIDAISGRGVVRNYNGFAADPMPVAYRYTLYGDKRIADAPGWDPDAIVVSLGTNDFSTPLHAGERWPTRDALHADFEATYVRFVRDLRARHPRALIVLWATDKAGGEIAAEMRKVADTLRAGGETDLVALPIGGLDFAACHSHPSLADDQRIADRLARVIAPRLVGAHGRPLPRG